MLCCKVKLLQIPGGAILTCPYCYAACNSHPLHVYLCATSASLSESGAGADFHVEELDYRSETGDSSQAWVPLRIIKPKHANGPLPTVVYLHATGTDNPNQLGSQLPQIVPCNIVAMFPYMFNIIGWSIGAHTPQESTCEEGSSAAFRMGPALCCCRRTQDQMQVGAEACLVADTLTAIIIVNKETAMQTTGLEAPSAYAEHAVQAATWTRCRAEQRREPSGAT